MKTRSQAKVEADKYDVAWALKKDNYCSFVPNDKKLQRRRNMIDEIYQIYEKLVKIIPETLSPDEWHRPPKHCYETELAVQLRDVQNDLFYVLNKRKKKKTSRINFNLYGRNVKSGIRNKYHGWTGDLWDTEFNGHERPNEIEKLEEEEEDSKIETEMEKYEKHYTGYAMDGFISDTDDYEC